MAVFSGPTTVKDSLVYHIDPANSRSYSQSNTAVLNNIGNTAFNVPVSATARDSANLNNSLILNGVTQNTIVPSGAPSTRKSIRFSNSDLGLPGKPNYLIMGDFTFEFWARFDASQTVYATFWDSGDAAWTGYKWGVTGAGSFWAGRVYLGPLFQNTDHRDNTWRHYAAVRTGNNLSLYVNGTFITSNTNFNQSNGVNFGSENRTSRAWAVPIGRGSPPYYPAGDNFMSSYVYGISLSNVARYSSNFTPSTTYTLDANTVILIESTANEFVSLPLSNGVFRNGVLYNSSNLGSFDFDGTNDYILTTGEDSITTIGAGIVNNFTYEIWCRPTATHEIDAESTATTTGTAGQKYAIEPMSQTAPAAGAGISIGTNGVSVYEHAASYMPPLLVYSGAISSTKISHIVVVYTNKTPSLYINGVLVRTGLTSPRTNVIADLVKIGSGVYGSFAGTIAQVRLYARSLTANEITQNFNSFRGRYEV